MPTAADVLASLNAAADAASDAFDAAVAANPAGNLAPLEQAKMKAVDAAASAINKALSGDPATVTAAQTALDNATTDIKGKLATLEDIQQWLTLLNNLVSLAATVAKFFV